MFQATQKAIVHNVNMILVDIRAAEVKYFSSCFVTFGTQAAIITSALCGIISNAHDLIPKVASTQQYIWQFIYFTATAACIVFGIQVLVTSLFTSVYGQGVALRGPLGSIAQTVDGMVIEQRQILASFVGMVFFFVVQYAALNMVMMDLAWGYVCVAINFIGLLVTYHYALRIYNKFNYPRNIAWDTDKQMIGGNGSAKNSKQIEDMLSHAIDKGEDFTFSSKNSSTDQIGSEGIGRNSSVGFGRNSSIGLDSPVANRSERANTGNTSNRESFRVSFQDTNRESGRFDPERLSFDQQIMLATDVTAGYLSMQTKNALKINVWTRRYFIIVNKNIFFFRDQKAYEKSPGNPINHRPIDLDGYYLEASGGSVSSGGSSPGGAGSMMGTSPVGGAGSLSMSRSRASSFLGRTTSVTRPTESVYSLTLTTNDPNDTRRIWHFRCDTMSEYVRWVDIFTRILKK